MNLKTIRLELARTKDHPQGDKAHAYEFRAPLDAGGHLDAAAWPAVKQLCVVKHFEGGVLEESGILTRAPGGQWVFSYKPGTEDDEPLFKLSSHSFQVGEYISITEHDGVQRTFRVASVVDWHPAR